MKNIVLIGMPASGKSTIGILLAKRLGLGFVDTDILIQQNEKRPLTALLDRADPGPFRALEELHVLTLDVSDTVIATGGSVIYGERAMQHLISNGIVIYLCTPLALLEMRISDLVARAVAMHPSQTLRDLYEERDPLYRRWANLTIDCLGLNHEGVVTAIKNGIPSFFSRNDPQFASP